MDSGQEQALWNTAISASLRTHTRRSEKSETTSWQHKGLVASCRVTWVISLGTGVRRGEQFHRLGWTTLSPVDAYYM